MIYGMTLGDYCIQHNRLCRYEFETPLEYRKNHIEYPLAHGIIVPTKDAYNPIMHDEFQLFEITRNRRARVQLESFEEIKKITQLLNQIEHELKIIDITNKSYQKFYSDALKWFANLT